MTAVELSGSVVAPFNLRSSGQGVLAFIGGSNTYGLRIGIEHCYPQQLVDRITIPVTYLNLAWDPGAPMRDTDWAAAYDPSADFNFAFIQPTTTTIYRWSGEDDEPFVTYTAHIRTNAYDFHAECVAEAQAAGFTVFILTMAPMDYTETGGWQYGVLLFNDWMEEDAAGADYLINMRNDRYIGDRCQKDYEEEAYYWYDGGHWAVGGAASVASYCWNAICTPVATYPGLHVEHPLSGSIRAPIDLSGRLKGGRHIPSIWESKKPKVKRKLSRVTRGIHSELHIPQAGNLITGHNYFPNPRVHLNSAGYVSWEDDLVRTEDAGVPFLVQADAAAYAPPAEMGCIVQAGSILLDSDDWDYVPEALIEIPEGHYLSVGLDAYVEGGDPALAWLYSELSMYTDNGDGTATYQQGSAICNGSVDVGPDFEEDTPLPINGFVRLESIVTVPAGATLGCFFITLNPYWIVTPELYYGGADNSGLYITRLFIDDLGPVPEPPAAIEATLAGGLLSVDASYVNAKEGSGYLAVGTEDGEPATYAKVGQRELYGDYYCDQLFIDFDTSSIPVDAEITSAVLSLHIQSENLQTWDPPDVDFTVEARVYDFGEEITTGDYVPSSVLYSLPRVATLYSGDLDYTDNLTYKDMTSLGLLIPSINVGGHTRLVLASSNQSDEVPPSEGSEDMLVIGVSSDYDEAPKLTVVYNVEEVSAPTETLEYHDGDDKDWQWAGEPHASISIGLALGALKYGRGRLASVRRKQSIVKRV